MSIYSGNFIRGCPNSKTIDLAETWTLKLSLSKDYQRPPSPSLRGFIGFASFTVIGRPS